MHPKELNNQKLNNRGQKNFIIKQIPTIRKINVKMLSTS